MIPVYQEDDAVMECAGHALTLDYPGDRFDVIVVADSLKKSTTDALMQLDCKVVYMNLRPRSKAKAINLAFVHLDKNDYDYCVVLDVDKHLSKNALHEFNEKFYLGAQAIQGQCVAKRITNPFQHLEAISQSIDNSIFRRGHTNLGLSAALTGSGMAFSYSLFKECMLYIDVTNGFDKDLEYEILSRRVKIHYLESVKVYSEKISSVEVLKKQRIRWFTAQIINMRKGIKFIFRRPSLEVLDKWWQMWLPSQFILVGFFSAMISVSIWFTGLSLLSLEFSSITFLLVLSLLTATPRRYYDRTLVKSLLKIPVTFFALTISFLSFPKAFNGFIRTPHQSHDTKTARI